MQLQDALAARLHAVPSPGAALNAPGPEARPLTRQASLPADAHAIIHCPAPSVMSGGRRGASAWVLEFVPRARQVIDPLMGWSGGGDPLAQLRLRFPSREAAIAYAQRQGLVFEVCEPTHLRHSDTIKTYVPAGTAGGPTRGIAAATACAATAGQTVRLPPSDVTRPIPSLCRSRTGGSASAVDELAGCPREDATSGGADNVLSCAGGDR
jgi:hypothetical protein